jgi:tetratricopeptide (TPR) repeat protein
MDRIAYRTFCQSAAQIIFFLSMFNGIATARTERDDYEKIRQSALAEFIKGHFADAEPLFIRALHEAETHHDDYAAAMNLSGLGDVYQNEGRFAEAEAAYRKSVSIFRRSPDSDLVLAIALHNLGSSLMAERRFPESLAALQEASQFSDKVSRPHQQLTGEIQNSLGVVYFYQGKMGKAESMFNAAISTYAGESAWAADISHSVNNLARVYQSKRKFAKAEELFKTSIRLTEERLGASHPELSIILENLGELYIEMKRYDEAAHYFQRSLAILEEGRPLLEFRILHTLHGLSKIFLAKGDKAQAETVLARATQIIGPKPTSNPEAPRILESYASLLKDSGKSGQAREIHYRAKRILASLAWTVRVQDLK